MHRILSPSQPLQKDNNPSPRTKLASLVKGEVLSPEKIRATTGGIASPPSLALHQPFQNCTIPRPAPPHLPPLSKGGGLTAKHKLLLCCVLLATRPPFYSLNFSAVKTEGLLYHPSLSTTSMPPLPKVRCCRPKKIGRLPEGLPHHQSFQTRTIPRLAPPLPPLSKVRCCRPKKFGRLPEGLPHRHPSPCTNPSKTALSLAPHHHTCLPCQREVD